VPGSAPVRINSIVFHGRTLRLHAEFNSGLAVVIDIPRRSQDFSFAVGEVAHVGLRPGANCPILPG
jgi:spermidine/putrescine transport system ATP-binding protein